jgi:hypothetical protein
MEGINSEPVITQGALSAKAYILLVLLVTLVACTDAPLEPASPVPPEVTSETIEQVSSLQPDTTATIDRPQEQPPTITPLPTVTRSPTPIPTETPVIPRYATLDDFWNGNAFWILDQADTGLPIGESDTLHISGDEYWSYLHASYQSAEVTDQCGDPVPFPGCTTLWKSYDGGRNFQLESPTCLFSCTTCPCDNSRDHIAQQQYPRVFVAPENQFLVYEFGAYVYLRTSTDGVTWSDSTHIPGTWIWDRPYGACDGEAVIGLHPHIYEELQYDCLVGGPPGIYVEDGLIYVFVALGQAPGHMGCLVGEPGRGAESFIPCTSNPLFEAERGYGPVETLGSEANEFFEFRTISSADVVRVGDHYYMTYEGVRGPSSYTVVDDQFGMGLARSVGPEIDGPWEKYPGNPIISDLPGNVGLGHADLIVVSEITYLYTATPEGTRGRYVLMEN